MSWIGDGRRSSVSRRRASPRAARALFPPHDGLVKKRILIAASLFATAFAVQAHEGLDLAQKSMAAAGATKSAPASLVAAHDPLPELFLRAEQERRGPRGACELAATDLCYDLTDGRLTYRGARRFMPRFEGLTAESISVRHDRVVFRYSFR